MTLPECIEVSNSHGRLCIPTATSHRPGVRIMLAGKVYEPLTIEFICRNVGAGDVIHAGAFCGDFLPALSKGVAGKVWAFEPVPSNFACAQRTLEINGGLANVHLMNAGLSDAKGAARMTTQDANGRDFGGSCRIDDAGDTSIETVRLDDVIPTDRQVSILHLDVEGHERDALRGGMEMIKRCRPILIIEEDVGRDLAELGYKFRYRVHNNVVYSVEPPLHAPGRESNLLLSQYRAAKRLVKSLLART
ncbi:MAG TPA: FkbM family methyltransferase [Aestuariivirgaceae bacterium]|nr:FkbM family methyltransferase [Aestuariivirgaceae bacterium]